MNHSSISLLNKWVEIHCGIPSTQQKVLIYRGKITQTDVHGVIVMCHLQEQYLNQEGSFAAVKILSPVREIGIFSAQVRRHVVDLETNQEVFVLEYSGKVQIHEIRDHPRISLGIPGKMSLISVNNKVLSLEARRQISPVVIRDISETGAQILTNIALPETAKISLRFRLDSNVIQENADLVWSKAVSGFYLYGVFFSNPDLIMQQLIRNFPRSEG